jgi:hypothetical protein
MIALAANMMKLAQVAMSNFLILIRFIDEGSPR